MEEKPNPKTEPEQKTTQANKQDTEGEADEPASPPVVQPLNAEGGEPKPAESDDKTDRKKDDALQSIANQTEWEVREAIALERQNELMEKQTVWIRRQALWTSALTIITLLVLVYHGYVMREQSRAADAQTAVMTGQSEAMKTQTDIMSKQLKSMESDSAQTQQMIDQNGELVAHAGEQAKALLAQADAAQTQANASQTQANASKEMVSQTARLVTSAEVQAGAMREQASTALKQFEVTDRPWLVVDVVPDGPISFDADGLNLPVRYVVKNVGRSVATGATVNAQAIIPKSEEDFFQLAPEPRETVCKNVNSRLMAYAVFPGDSFIRRQNYGIGKQEVERGRLRPTNFIRIFLVGCVDYQFGEKSAHHQTGFIYEIHRIDPAKPGIFALQVGENLPPDRFVLLKSIVDADYAN